MKENISNQVQRVYNFVSIYFSNATTLYFSLEERFLSYFLSEIFLTILHSVSTRNVCISGYFSD